MNTYFALCGVLCLGIFCATLFAGSLLAETVAAMLKNFRSENLRTYSPKLLFLLRIFPFGFSAGITLGLALPAFLLLEPKQTAEAPETYLIVFAVIGAACSLLILIRLVRLLLATKRLSCEWRRSAVKIPAPAEFPVFRVEGSSSLFAVVGIFKPRVFIGGDLLDCLTPEELHAALAHERAHVRSFDNLKRALLSMTLLPSVLRNLAFVDRAWDEASELAADSHSIDRTSALDLASALVKIAGLRTASSARTHLPSVAACHLLSENEPSGLAVRLERVRNLLSDPAVPSARRPILWGRVFAVAAALLYVISLPSILVFGHRFMEALVK